MIDFSLKSVCRTVYRSSFYLIIQIDARRYLHRCLYSKSTGSWIDAAPSPSIGFNLRFPINSKYVLYRRVYIISVNEVYKQRATDNSIETSRCDQYSALQLYNKFNYSLSPLFLFTFISSLHFCLSRLFPLPVARSPISEAGLKAQTTTFAPSHFHFPKLRAAAQNARVI